VDKIACSFGTYFLLRFQLVYSLGIAERNVVSSYRVTETRVFGSLHVFRVPKDNYNKCAKKNVQILCTLKSYSTTDCLLQVPPGPSGSPVGRPLGHIRLKKAPVKPFVISKSQSVPNLSVFDAVSQELRLGQIGTTYAWILHRKHD